jgi:hypothetical protein
LVLLNAVALVGVVASGAYFRQEFAASGIETPLQTEIAIGWIPPAILTCNLLVAICASDMLPSRFLSLYKLVVLVICGMVVVQHVIGITLAYTGITLELSQSPLARSAYCG